ncbi:MAG: class I SAM-dependent RNA methyltransferase [Pseudomonadota bacterium]
METADNMNAETTRHSVSDLTSSETEVLVERFSRSGEGIAGRHRIQGALPGEVWRLSKTPKLVRAVPDRVDAPCPVFQTCGGCSLQHASDSFVADWKAQLIAAALRAHGLETEIRTTQTSPPRSRRRAGIAGRRTKKGVKLGFHARRTHEIVALEECHVLEPQITGALPLLQRMTRIAAPRAREIRLQVTSGPAGLDIDLRDTKPLDAALRGALAELATEGRVARLCVDGEMLFQAHPPHQVMGSARVVPPPGGFLQATAAGEGALVSAVLEIVSEAKPVVDLFAGCGTFALRLAERASVLAVEADRQALAALDAAWRGTAGLRPVRCARRDLFRRPLLADELAPFDAVVLDPPRAGAQAQTAELAKSRVDSIAYVSCDPVTFARDAAQLVSAGFRLNWIQPVDQFLWSDHVELAAAFSR